MKRAFFLIALVLVAAVSLAQEPPNKFRLRIGQRAQGVEEYRSEKTPEGYRQTGKTHLEAGGSVQESNQKLQLGSDGNLVKYRLEVRRGEQTQRIEAQRNGEKVHVQIQAGARNPSVDLDFHPGLVVLDNVVAAHYQGLLDSLPKGPEPVARAILVPQAMVVIKGTVQAQEEEQATLDGQSLRVRKYKLEAGASLTEIWAASASNQLMRVYVPLQDVELLREGFALAAKTEAARAPSAGRERELKFPSGDLQMPGTLCLPLTAQGPVPLVVLVQGSGSHDRDETVGPNKPFRDLAQGLAAAGIATLRYDKRTYAFPESFGPKATVEEEVIADAVAALAYARALPEVDPKRTFLLGHSLGASMAPFVVERSPETRGVILMAAAGRPLDELIYEQKAFQGRNAGLDEAAVTRGVDALKKAFARVRSGAAADSELIMNAPAAYWRDLLRRDTPAELKKLKQPVLVLQGGQDVQVRRADYDAIVQALGGKCEAHLLPTLNHLFIPVEGKATGAEYGVAGHIDPQVIQIVAAWIKKRS